MDYLTLIFKSLKFRNNLIHLTSNFKTLKSPKSFNSFNFDF